MKAEYTLLRVKRSTRDLIRKIAQKDRRSIATTVEILAENALKK